MEESADHCPAEALPIRQDASLLVAVLATHGEVTYTLEPGRRTYMVGTQGALEVNGHVANSGERVIASGSGTLQVRALAPTELVVLDVV
jgi:redox-sensitive bicupin YhaK (pirin superfamily)